MKTIKKILVACDLSKNSGKVIKHGADLAKDLGADLIVANVINQMDIDNIREAAPEFASFQKWRRTMGYEEGKEKIVSELQRKKGKTKFYFNDLAKILGEKPRPAKKIVNKMIEEGVLEYWSTESTSLYGLTGTGKQAAAEEGR
jgi:nucleotide-binding universal stress UspA family protein